MLNKLKNAAVNYWKDEDAVDDSITKIIMIVVGIACATAVGWYVWNILQKRTEQSSCANNPGPFCVE